MTVSARALARQMVAATLAVAAAAAAAQDSQRGRDLYLNAAAVKGVTGLPSCVQCHGLPPDRKLVGASPAQLQGAFASVIAMGRFALELDARDLADLSAFLRDPAAVASPLPAVAPLSPAFAALPGTRSPALALRLTNDGAAALVLAARDAVALAGADAAQFVLTRGGCVDGAVLAPAAWCEVTLQYAPPTSMQPPAPPQAQLQWRYASIAQPTVLSLAAQPQAAAALSVSATGLSFGAVAVGATASRRLRMENGGQDVLALQSLALGGPAVGDFRVSGCGLGARIAPGAGCDIDIAFTPSTAGTRQAQLDIDGSGGRRAIALVGEAPGASPGTSPAPPAVIDAPSSAPLPVAVANAGGGALSLATALLLPLALWRRRRI